MTIPPDAPDDTGASTPEDNEISHGEAGVVTSFANLDAQLEQAPSFASAIVRKHWVKAEREQYPFWIGMLLMAILGIIGFILKDIDFFPHFVGIIFPIIMLAGLVIVVGFYLNGLRGRFGRQWDQICNDGQLFRFLSDAAVVLGFPIELGEHDKNSSTHLDLGYEEACGAVHDWVKKSALPDPPPSGPDAPTGLLVPKSMLESPPGSEFHCVYEAEYRGKTVREMSIRLDAKESGCDVTIGFIARPPSAETRDRLVEVITGCIQDRMIAAKVLGDIREAAGVDPVPIQAAEEFQQYPGTAESSAI